MKSKLKYLTMLLLCISSFSTNCKYALIEEYISPGAEIITEITKYVSSTNGDDATADGSKEKPYKTIQAAINACAAGDKIAVAAGTYNETITMVDGISIYGGFTEDFSNRNNVDRSNTTYKTHIFPNAGNEIIQCSSISNATTIDGFVISWDGITGITGIELISNSSPTITNNTIFGGNNAASTYGLTINGNSNPKIINNVIRAGQNTDNYAVYINQSSPEVRNNDIQGNAGARSAAIHITGNCIPVISYNNINGGSGNNNSYALYINNGADPKINHNKIHGGTSNNGPIAIQIENNGTDAIIHANEITAGNSASAYVRAFVIIDNPAAIIMNNILHGGSSDTIDYFNIENNTAGGTLKILNNSIVDGTCSNTATAFNLKDSRPVLYNNIIKITNGITTKSIYIDGTPTPDAKYNWTDFTLTSNGDTSNHTYGATNILNMPVNFNSNFRPDAAATHNGGCDASGLGVVTDYYDNPRTPPYSMGAYEVD